MDKSFRIEWVFSLVLAEIFFSPVCFGVGITLDQAFRTALEKNESIQQNDEQGYQLEQRRFRLRAGLFPEVSLNTYHLFQSTPDSPIAREFSPSHQTTVNVMLVQPVFRGFREFAGLRQLKELQAAQEALKRQDLERLYQNVAMLYLNVLNLEQDLKNIKGQVEIYEHRAHEILSRTRRVESSTTELLSTQSTQNSLLAEARLVEGQVKVARDTFHSLTGMPRDASLEDPYLDSKKKIVVGDIAEYIKQIEKRPDIQGAVAQRDAAEEAISVARGAHLPTVDAIGNYYFTRPGFLSDIRWDVSLRLAFPLFSGGAVQAQVREARSRVKELDLEIARTRRLANEEIQSLYGTLQAKLEHFSLLQQACQLAEKNVSVSQTELRRGLIRSIDVQIALGEYRMIRRSLDQAFFSAQLDRLKLEIASGTKTEILFEEATRK